MAPDGGRRAYRGVVCILAVVLVLAAAACGSRARSPGGPAVPGPTDVPPPNLAVRPDGRARQFLDLVREGRYAQAYDGFLAQEARARVSKDQFVGQLTEAMKTASTRAGYENRWVQSERIEAGVAVLVISDRKFPEAVPWTWEFVREGGEWRLRRLYLPPIVTHPR